MVLSLQLDMVHLENTTLKRHMFNFVLSSCASDKCFVNLIQFNLVYDLEKARH